MPLMNPSNKVQCRKVSGTQNVVSRARSFLNENEFGWYRIPFQFHCQGTSHP